MSALWGDNLMRVRHVASIAGDWHASGRAGLTMIRRAWVNRALMWGVALVLTAAAVALA